MELRKQTLLLKIKKLSDLVNKLSENFSELPPQMQHILNTAPQALFNLKATLEMEDQQNLLEIHKVLEQVGTLIECAAGVSSGEVMAKSIESGASPDLSLPATRRLNQRMTQFLARYVDRERFSDLVQEFCGREAIQGNTIYMDPGSETEAFTQWILFDKILEGLPKRLAELFSEDVDALPLDERKVLEAQLQDRPSVYRVLKMGNKIGMYLIEDLLSDEGKSFNIKDQSTSVSFSKGSIFIGRAFPALDETSVYLLMGSVTEISQELWEKLSLSIKQWEKAHASNCPEAVATDFFRAHHPRIQSFIHGR